MGSPTRVYRDRRGGQPIWSYSWAEALNTAASTTDQRWMIQPSKTSHKTKAATNMKMALIHLPWSSCPKPGMKKLQRAAMMLAVLPFLDMIEFVIAVGG